MLLRWLNYLALGATLALFISYQANVIERPFTWDEVDYSNVAGKGIKYNALEENSLNIKQFIALSRTKAGNASPDSVSLKSVNEATDPFRLRHFHPPLPVYYWALFHSPDHEKNDIRLKWSHIIFGIIILLSMLLIFRHHMHSTRSLSFITLGIVLLFTSSIFLESFTMLQFHIFFLAAGIIYSFVLNRYLDKPSRNNAILLGASVTGLFITLETAPFIIFSTIAGIFLARLHKKFSWKLLLNVIASALVTILILWPGGIIKGSPFKSIAIYVYRIFFQSNVEYSTVNYSAMWGNIIKENILLVSGLVLVIILNFRNLRKNPAFSLPFINGVIYLAAMTPFILNRTYVLPAVGFLVISVIYLAVNPGSTRSDNPKPASAIALAAAFGILAWCVFATDWNGLKKRAGEDRNELMSDISAIKELSGKGKPMYIDGAHVIAYYWPAAAQNSVNMELKSYTDPGFYERVNYQYVSREEKVRNHDYGLVAIRKAYTKAQADSLKSWGYKEKVLNKYVIFY
jgi:hypothetical protein